MSVTPLPPGTKLIQTAVDSFRLILQRRILWKDRCKPLRDKPHKYQETRH